MDKQELIEKYLQGLLTVEEEQTFHLLKLSDLEFKNEVDFQFALKQALILEKEERLKTQLATFEKAFSAESRTIPVLFKWAGAAVFVISICLSILFLYNPKPTADTLFAAYFTPAENIHYPITRGFNDTLITQAFTSYEQGHYEQAILLFQALENTGNYEYLKLYMGSSHLGLGQIQEALAVLDPSPYENSPMEYRFKWYQSLALIKAGDFEKARHLLVQIVANKGYQSDNAGTLLEKLPKK